MYKLQDLHTQQLISILLFEQENHERIYEAVSGDAFDDHTKVLLELDRRFNNSKIRLEVEKQITHEHDCEAQRGEDFKKRNEQR
jgi:hypothetical protein